MNLNYIYENRHLIPEDNMKHFEDHRKYDLSLVEMIGLETVLCEFVKQYEESEFGECYGNLRDYTRWDSKAGMVDLLDGCHDTYVFDGVYAISEIWIAYEGCIMLSCYELKSEEYDDPAEILNFTDWQCECKPALFRLD